MGQNDRLKKAVDNRSVPRYRWRMTDHERRDLMAENSLLRGCLFITARRLKDYHDAPHFEIESEDDIPGMEVIVPASLRPRAAEALEKAQAILKGEGRGR